MRRPWIKIETSTPDKPEICSIATTLRMDTDTVVGKLVRLWSWVELNSESDDDLGVTCEFLDKLVGRKGFSQALQQTGWLVNNDGKLSLKNFDRHSSLAAKGRALTALRVARHRLRKISAGAANVTSTPDGMQATGTRPSPKTSRPNKRPAIRETDVSPPAEESTTESEAVEPSPAPPFIATDEPVPITAPATPPDEPLVVPSEAAESAVVEDAPGRGRRKKATEASDDQPLLF